MVILRLLSVDGTMVSYRYYPEGKNEYGIVSLSDGKRRVDKQAEGYSNTYAFHALKRMEEYIEHNSFPEEDMVAWY